MTAYIIANEADFLGQTVNNPCGLTWTPAGAVSVRSGDELWLIEPSTGKTEKTLIPSAEQAPAPPELRQRRLFALAE